MQQNPFKTFNGSGYFYSGGRRYSYNLLANSDGKGYADGDYLELFHEIG